MEMHFIDNSNMRAMAGSIALHVLIGFWVLSNVVPVEIMPQQIIKITMIAASAEKIVKQKSQILPQEKPQPKKTVKPVKLDVIQKKSAQALYQQKIISAVPPPPKQQSLSALNSSVGNVSSAQTSAQLVTTAPLFDAAYLNNPAPEYPAKAKTRGMEGSVMLSVIVRKDGTAKLVIIEKSSGFAMLDESAKDAVSLWKFVPAKRGSETVEARVMIPIDFKLES